MPPPLPHTPHRVEARWAIVVHFLAAFSMAAIVSPTPLHAQGTTNDTVDGVVTIKFAANVMPSLMPGPALSTTDGDVVVAGIRSVDAINKELRVRTMERVFRPAGRHEGRHIQWGLDRWYRLTFDAETDVDLKRILERYTEDPNIEVSAPEHVKTTHARLAGPRSASGRLQALAAPTSAASAPQWHFHNTGQTGGTPGADINLQKAHEVAPAGSPEAIVQIIDTGIQPDHPALQHALWRNPCEHADGTDTCGNGYVDDVHGYNFADDNSSVDPVNLSSELQSHGTHVAGIIAAASQEGFTSIAGGDGHADSGVRIMPSVAFGNNVSGFAEAIVYGADNGAAISNNSWGYERADVYEPAVLDAIDYFVANAGSDPDAPMQGGLFISSAGNANSSGAFYPAAYPGAMSVAATNHHDAKATYSNFGAHIDLAAPGGEAFSHPIISTLHEAHGTFGGPQWVGTSMAAPQVAGVAALLLSHHPSLSAEEVRERLCQTGVDVAPEAAIGRRLDAYQALRNTSPPPSDELPVTIDPAVLTQRIPVGTTARTSFHLTNNSQETLTYTSDEAVSQLGKNQMHPASGTVAPGASAAIELTTDAADLPAGGYRDTLIVPVTIGSADDILRVPLTLQVVPSLRVYTPGTTAHPNESVAIPLRVESLDALNVQSYEFTLRYDTTRLAVEGLSTEGTLSERAGLAINHDEAGVLRVAALRSSDEGTAAEPLIERFTGEGTLLHLQVRAKEQLGSAPIFIDQFRFNDGVGDHPEATINLEFLTVHPLYGDVALNLTISGFDAALALQYDVGRRTLNETQRKAGDVSASGAVSAFDASLIQQYVVGLLSHFPADSLAVSPSTADVGRGMLLWGTPRPSSSDGLTRLPLLLRDTDGPITSVSLEATLKPSSATVEHIDFLAPDDWLSTYHKDASTLRLASAGASPMREDTVAILHLRRPTQETPLSFDATGHVNEQPSHELSATFDPPPREVALDPNYPNPFRTTTTIPYALSKAAQVRLTVYNVLGQRVRVLVDDEQTPGRHEATWDGLSGAGSPVSSGVYLYRLDVKGESHTQQLLFIR